MTNALKDKLIALGIIVLFSGILVFAYIKTRPIWHGVDIVLKDIRNGQKFESPSVTLNGRAKRATELRINGRAISIDENGYFTEKILIPPGYSIITAEAKDKFGNYTVESREVYNKEIKKNYLEPIPEETPSTEEAPVEENEEEN